MLEITREQWLDMVAHAIDEVPDEACGLVATSPGSDRVEAVYRCRNAAASARVYEVHPLDHLRADRDADSRGLVIAGVYHSHTRTDAYPSPTDVAQAPDPDWHYLLVSLRHPEPVMRSFRIAGGAVDEEPVAVLGR